MTRSTLLEALRCARDEAPICEQLLYICERSSAYIITPQWADDWLIKVYPGGRAEASMAGAKEMRMLIRRSGSDYL